MARSKACSFVGMVGRRRFWGGVWVFVGAVVVGGFCWLAVNFILLEAFELQGRARLLLTVFGILLTVAYLGGIAVRSVFVDNVDTVVARMGPIEKQVLKAAFEEDEA